MPPRLWGMARHRHAGRAGCKRWISPRFVTSATCMGPPLTESPGRCQVDERRHTGSPSGASTAVCGAGCACSKDDGNSGAASGAVRTIYPRHRRVLKGTPSGQLLASRCRHYEMKVLGGEASKATPAPTRQVGALEGRVTTATPFAPRWSWPGGHGSPQLTPPLRWRQRPTTARPSIPCACGWHLKSGSEGHLFFGRRRHPGAACH